MANIHHDQWDYRRLLIALNQGYKFVFFGDCIEPHGQILLRHDIDFDCELAAEMARVEHELGIKSTYFFLVTSESYNIGSPKNKNAIHAIKKMGHKIGVHYDPTIYDDCHKGLKVELNYFEDLFEIKTNIISLHRPHDYFLKKNEPINELEHTYLSKYFEDIKYFADSTGTWRYGHPLDSAEFHENRSLQILIHPIWWQIEGASNIEKLIKYHRKKQNQTKEHFGANCKPFLAISNYL